MSKAINVQSGHYKVAGRERPGDGLLQEQQKQAFAEMRESARRGDIAEHSGIPAWEATPQNFETEGEPAASRSKPARKAKGRKRTVRRARTRPRRKPAKRVARRAASKTTKSRRRAPAARSSSRR